jgi:hypothetical protein
VVTDLLILAVARMQSGVCIAGVSPDGPLGSPVWVRPVKPFGTLRPDDIRYGDEALMQPWDVAALALARPRPRPPHHEDVETDFLRQRPLLRGRVEQAQRSAWLERLAEEDPHAVWAAQRRSITLFRPPTVSATFAFDAYSERYEARLHWPRCGRPDGLPVTDLKWRALGRRLTAEGAPELHLDEAALRSRFGFEVFYLVLGLSREFQGEHWPLVAAVHTLPDYEAGIDARRL